MNFIGKGIALAALILSSFQAIGGTDPVTWRVNRSFPDPIYTGRNYTVTYTITSQLPFTMVAPLVITKNAIPAGDFSYIDTCTGTRLARYQNCIVKVMLTPAEAGKEFIQLGITGYDRNRVLLPAQAPQALGQSVSTQSIYSTVLQSFPATLNASQPAQYVFSFTNRGSTPATGVTVQVSQTQGTATYATDCSSSLLAGQSCSVSGTYTPTSAIPTVQSVNAVFHYAQGLPVAAATSTTVTAVSGVVGSFNGNFYLPAVMVAGPANPKTIWFLFTNHSNTMVNLTSRTVDITGVGGGAASFTYDPNPALDNCTGPLNPGAQCQIKGVFEANAVVTPTPVSVTATVNYTGGSAPSSSIATSTTLVASLGTSRTLTLINKCGFSVWFSLNGGAVSTTAKNCPTVACPTGTSCNTTNHTCYWKNYAPDGVSVDPYLLTNNATKTVTILQTSVDPAVLWSGNISASTGCAGATCTQATCQNNGGTTACAPGIGFSQPATEAEITMNKSTTDSYDVEVINGFHIPISMEPGPYVTPNNYFCGTPGAFAAGNGFGACNWTQAILPGNGYYWVSTSTKSCNLAAPSCQTPTDICGLDSSLNPVCGAFLGYWTANEVCSKANVPAAVKSYFRCDANLRELSKNTIPFPANAILYDLMSCPVPTGDALPPFNSCYLAYPNYPHLINQCCGCKDWWTAGIGANPNTQSCTQPGKASPQTDPVWNSYVQPGVQWMKKTCPSLYVYPFDDKTSSFTCTNTLPGEPNSVGYTITFCPGNSGAPTGKTDGR